MNQFEAMRIYVRVAELASFTGAAQSLGVPKATVSNAVQQLENQLGVRLLQRTTRRVQMTQDGQVFYVRSCDILSDMEDLQNMFGRREAALQGKLRVDLSVGVARDMVLPRLPEFMDAHPGIALEFSSTDRFVDLLSEGFDCVLRIGTLADSSLVARPLGHFRLANYASADYLACHGTPRTLEDLAVHSLIHYVNILGSKSEGFVYLDPADGCEKNLPMGGRLTVNNSSAYEGACLAGFGIIQAPEVGMRGHVAAGRVVEILQTYLLPPLPVALLYTTRHHVPRRVQVFMQWLSQILQPYLMDTPGGRKRLPR